MILVSPANYTISTTAIVDAAGNIWEMVASSTSGNQVVKDGKVDTTTANAVLLLYYNRTVYHKNTSNNWYAYNGTGWTWVASDPRTTPTPTPAPTPTPTPARRAGTRFPYATSNYTVPAWPFAYNSVWNLGIGSNALYSGPSGSDPVTANLLSAGSVVMSSPGIANDEWNYPVYVGASTDTVFAYTGMSGWPNLNGSGDQSVQTGSIHIPGNAVASSDGDVLLGLMDATQPSLFITFFDRTVLNRTAHTVGTTYGWSAWDTSGNGRAIYGQGNQHMALQGADLDNITNGGGIYRMLPCHLLPTQQKAWGPISNWSNSLNSLGFYNCVWPAIASDYYGGNGSGSEYSGQIPFGSIIFIPKAVLDMSTWSFGGTNPLGLTRGGMAIAQQLQNYGWHDENTGGSFSLYTSWDARSTTTRTTRYNEIASVLTSLLQYMRVMPSWMTGMAPGATPSKPPGNGYQYDPNYNPSAPVNGGGTYPPPPPYWDPSLPTIFTSQNTY